MALCGFGMAIDGCFGVKPWRSGGAGCVVPDLHDIARSRLGPKKRRAPRQIQLLEPDKRWQATSDNYRRRRHSVIEVDDVLADEPHATRGDGLPDRLHSGEPEAIERPCRSEDVERSGSRAGGTGFCPFQTLVPRICRARYFASSLTVDHFVRWEPARHRCFQWIAPRPDHSKPWRPRPTP